MKSCVIFNPAARGEKARRFRRHLEEIGTQTTLKSTASIGDARRLAAEAVAEGFDTIIAAGGDGTLNEVLNGLGDVSDGFERTRLGVLPLGTVNVFAREMNIPRDVMSAWEVVQRNHETRIDLPFVDFQLEAKEQRRYFAQLAGAGLDARAVELVAWNLKKRFGPLAYVWAGLQALLRKASSIEVNADAHSLKGGLVLIGNGQLYGGQFRVFPQADLRDGLLDVCVFPRVNWFVLARCGPQLLLRGNLPAGVAKVVQARTIKISAAERTPTEVDGELFGQLPATFSLMPSRLRVVIP